jgi:hypothetical protein
VCALGDLLCANRDERSEVGAGVCACMEGWWARGEGGCSTDCGSWNRTLGVGYLLHLPVLGRL